MKVGFRRQIGVDAAFLPTHSLHSEKGQDQSSLVLNSDRFLLTRQRFLRSADRQIHSALLLLLSEAESAKVEARYDLVRLSLPTFEFRFRIAGVFVVFRAPRKNLGTVGGSGTFPWNLRLSLVRSMFLQYEIPDGVDDRVELFVLVAAGSISGMGCFGLRCATRMRRQSICQSSQTTVCNPVDLYRAKLTAVLRSPTRRSCASPLPRLSR